MVDLNKTKYIEIALLGSYNFGNYYSFLCSAEIPLNSHNRLSPSVLSINFLNEQLINVALVSYRIIFICKFISEFVYKNFFSGS